MSWCARAPPAALAASGCCRNSLRSESSLIGVLSAGAGATRVACASERSKERCQLCGALVSVDLLTTVTLFELERARRKIRPWRSNGFFGTRLVEESQPRARLFYDSHFDASYSLIGEEQKKFLTRDPGS